MSIKRFIVSLVIVLGMNLILSLSCATQPEQAPGPAPSPQFAPTAPALSQPTNESTASSLTVKLEWNPSTDATSYSLQVATDSAFTKPVIYKAEIASTSHEVTSGLDWKTDYYWRVNASNASGTSSWSGSWKFNTPDRKSVV